MTLGARLSLTPLLDGAGDGTGGGGTSAAGSTGAGASGQPQTSQGSTSGQTSNQPQQTSGQTTGQTGSTTGYSYPEDRSDWVPRHRLNEQSQKIRDYETKLEDAQRRLTLALGGTVTDPQTQKAEAIKEAFFNLPGMARLKKLIDLSEDEYDALFSAPQHIAASQTAEAAQWQRFGNQIVDTVSQKIAESIGAETLDAEQKADLRISLDSWLKGRIRAELAQASERYGEEAVSANQRRFSPSLRRYEEGDAKLLDEFVTRYTKTWVEPARRSATASHVNRTRPVPNAQRGNGVASSVKRPDKFNSLDERIAYASEVAKERGLVFGR